MDLLHTSIRGFPAFLLYFASSLALLVLFITIYIRITPYREITLIRQGNVAAAASLSGAMLGFVVPLAHSVAQSANLADMALWGLIALIVQLLVYFAVTRVMPGISSDIPAGKTAPGVFLGSISLATGILNSACMTY
ncbi:MAG: putative rane protein [Betaproteobacteria bacterium]|nr:putative rane protein [Betaproteobacteria bacterium]